MTISEIEEFEKEFTEKAQTYNDLSYVCKLAIKYLEEEQENYKRLGDTNEGGNYERKNRKSSCR